MELPENYQVEMKELFGEDWNAYLGSFADGPYSSLRVNTAKISVPGFSALAPFHLQNVPWTENGFYFAEKDDPTRHPYYRAGLYYIQEPSAMIPASVLPVEPGDLVLDACAAPGGKSFELASRLNGTGLLVSNDLSFSRQNATLKNLEKAGAANILVTGNDIRDFKDAYTEFFDKILLDAPCSGEGMFRKNPSLIRSYEKHGSDEYVPLQTELLETCVRYLKPGGQLVYSTCTFSVQENEGVLETVMNRHPELKILPVNIQADGVMPGIGERFSGCVRLYPHKIRGEGHFCALLRKDGEDFSRAEISFVREPFSHPEWTEFRKHLRKDFSGMRTVLFKDRLHAVPEIRLPDQKLRILRFGLWLGTLKNRSFEPSQSLAMSLKASEFDNVLQLEPDDPRLSKYLKGETVPADGVPKGWVLVCVNDYPLGFAKSDGSMLKNKLSPSWRQL